MYEDNFKRTINGIEFEVFVKERENYRTIMVHDVEQCDKATSHDGGLFKEPTTLPDRQKHVAKVFSKAMSKYFDRQEELERRQNEVEQALDAATNVWNE